jgi:hypothetical protein
MRSRFVVASIALVSLCNCGVPRSELDAASADQQKKAQADHDAEQNQLADLRARLI